MAEPPMPMMAGSHFPCRMLKVTVNGRCGSVYSDLKQAEEYPKVTLALYSLPTK